MLFYFLETIEKAKEKKETNNAMKTGMYAY